jgi:hypothetical protein
MLYKELKSWFIEWLKEQNEPVPLNVGNYFLSPDIRLKINNDIERIDGILKERGKPNEYARTLLGHLKKIKEAIENKQHDISGYNWKVMEKWLENEK